MRLFLCCRTSVKFVTVGLKRGLFLQRVSSGEATWSPQSLSRGEARPEGKEEIIGVEAGGRIRDKRVTEITQSRNKKDTEHRSGRKHMRKRWQKRAREIRHVSGRKHPVKAMMADGTFIAMEFAVTSDKSQVFFFIPGCLGKQNKSQTRSLSWILRYLITSISWYVSESRLFFVYVSPINYCKRKKKRQGKYMELGQLK